MTRNELEVIKGALNASTYMMRHSHEFKQISAALALVNAALDEPAADGWQAIETAPKDGTDIIGCWSGSRMAAVLHFRNNSWRDCNGEKMSRPNYWATMLPLPLPPGGRT